MSEPDRQRADGGGRGAAAARDALLREHYDEFRRVAGRVLNGDAAALQIQPTDLAHEAVIRLSGLDRLDFKGRTHFLSLSARVMRQILIDEIRRMRAAKRQAPPVSTQLPPELGAQNIDLEDLDFKGRTHFLSLSARVMRQILIDEIRRMRAAKRQAPPVSTQLPPELGAQNIDLEDLDRALSKLETVAPDHARLVEQRYFAGLTLEEIADIDGVSVRTVKRQWRAARAWLVSELGQR